MNVTHLRRRHLVDGIRVTLQVAIGHLRVRPRIVMRFVRSAGARAKAGLVLIFNVLVDLTVPTPWSMYA